MTLDAGLHFDIPEDTYHSDPAPEPSLSSGLAHTLLTLSPRHAWVEHPRLGGEPRPNDPRFDLGTAAHAMLLQGESVIVAVDAKDWRTKAAQEARRAAWDAGKTPLLVEQAAAVAAMVKSCEQQLEGHPCGSPFDADDGKAEVSGFWQEGEAWCRLRADYLSTSMPQVWDYKTTYCAKPERWQRTLYQMGADLQAAFYLRGLKACGVPVTNECWRWIVQETKPPFALSVCTLSPYGWELAERKVDLAISQWQDAISSDAWPAYPPALAVIDPPGWEEAEQTSRELSTEEAEAAFEMQKPL